MLISGILFKTGFKSLKLDHFFYVVYPHDFNIKNSINFSVDVTLFDSYSSARTIQCGHLSFSIWSISYMVDAETFE